LTFASVGAAAARPSIPARRESRPVGRSGIGTQGTWKYEQRSALALSAPLRLLFQHARVLDPEDGDRLRCNLQLASAAVGLRLLANHGAMADLAARPI
jgi:hypothetical protein